MAVVKLGPSGSETTLPIMEWMKGNKPDLTVETEKQIEMETMTDGTIRYAMFQNKRIFPLFFGFITFAQLTVLKNLQALNQTLRYQNTFEDTTWYNVIILTFNHSPAEVSIRQMGYYKCSMTLMEV